MLVLRLKYRPWEGSPQKKQRQDPEALSARLDARKPLREIFAEDVVDGDDESNVIIKQHTEIQILSERLNEIWQRYCEYDVFFNSDKIETTFRPLLSIVMGLNFACYLKFSYRRALSLKQWTMPRIQRAYFRGDLLHALIYSPVVDRLTCYIRLAENDPDRQRWEDCKVYDDLAGLDRRVRDHLEYVE